MPFVARPAWVLGIGLSGLLGCSEDALTPVESALEATPPALDFGEGCVGGENVETLMLRNPGRVPTLVERAAIVPSTAPFDVDALASALPPGGEREVQLRFSPTVPGAASAATLVVRAQDGVTLEVPLTGRAGVRRLEVVPARVDFGVVDEGTPARRTIELRNRGGSPLHVSEVIWTSTSADLVPAEDAFRGGVIPAKSAARFGVRYAPTDLGSDRATLVVFSDDPARPRWEVPVAARANLRPRVDAVGCRRPAATGAGCAPGAGRPVITAGAGQTVYLDATRAEDPEGGPLGFSWSTPARPPQSFTGAVPHPTVPGAADILVDRVGSYAVEVVARDARGVTSLPARVEIEPRDLEVRLDWDVATDVDLHLVRPGGEVGDYGSGVPGRSEGSDCSTFNRAPRWGDPADPYDDPRLDRDAVSTPGAELAGLDLPEAGEYVVYAHHCDSRGVGVATAAQLEVRSRGRTVAELGPVELGPGDLWAVAALRWRASDATLSVRPLAARVEHRPEVCRTSP